MSLGMHNMSRVGIAVCSQKVETPATTNTNRFNPF